MTAEEVTAAAAVGALLISIGALVIARGTSQSASRANTISTRANTISEDANRLSKSAIEIAEGANAISAEANAIAKQAVTEARRSADSAEAALALQREEQVAAETERLMAVTARVEPITWDGRVRAGPDQGMQFRNFGRAAARDFVGVFVHGGLLMVTRAAIGVDELVAFRSGYKPWDGDDIGEAPAFEQGREVAARAFWTNEDGSRGDSGWKVIPRI